MSRTDGSTPSGRPRTQGRANVAPRTPPIAPAAVLWSAIRVIQRRKLVAIAAFVLVLVPALLYTMTSRPLYRSTARVIADSNDPSVALLGERAQQPGPRQGYVETLAEVVKSRDLAEDAVRALKLWSHPDFVKDFGSYAADAEAPADETTPPKALPTGLVESFMGRTVVGVIPGSQILTVSYSSYDPQLAADGANALTKAFVNRDLESRFSAVKGAADWLSDRLADQRQRVTESEAALQRYREGQDAASLDDRQNIVVQRLADLNASVTRARTERIVKEELFKQIEAVQNDRQALDTVPVIVSNAYVQGLKSQVAASERELLQLQETFGERHPEIIRVKGALAEAQKRLDGEVTKLVQTVKNDYQAALAQEQSLAAALEAQKDDALSLGRKGVEYAALSREAETNREIYQGLLQQAKEAGITSELKRSNLRVIDVAQVPLMPVGPIGASAAIIAVFGSFVFAIGLVCMLEYLDSRLKTPEDVPRHLGVPLLGYLPAIKSKTPNAHSDMLFTSKPSVAFGEAVRRVRANVELASNGGSQVLLITSTGPKEGKTVVSTNLAAALARAGRRVLIIDADLRRPRVHSAFGLKMEPGVSSVLTGTHDFERALSRSEAHPGLAVMTSGLRPQNPAELLASPGFQHLIEQAREQFDWVLIDSPPIMAVADSSVVASLADSVLFVAAADVTRTSAASVAIEQLMRASTPIIGGVLNRVTVPAHLSYLYSAYYNPDYEVYYRADGTKDKRRTAPKASRDGMSANDTTPRPSKGGRGGDSTEPPAAIAVREVGARS